MAIEAKVVKVVREITVSEAQIAEQIIEQMIDQTQARVVQERGVRGMLTVKIVVEQEFYRGS